MNNKHYLLPLDIGFIFSFMYLNPIEYCIKHMEQKPSQRKSHLKAGFDTHTESAQCLGAQHRKWNQRREPNAHIDVSKRHEFGRIRCIRYIASCNLSCVPLLLINSHGSHCAAVFYFQFWIFCFHLKKKTVSLHTHDHNTVLADVSARVLA